MGEGSKYDFEIWFRYDLADLKAEYSYYKNLIYTKSTKLRKFYLCTDISQKMLKTLDDDTHLIIRVVGRSPKSIEKTRQSRLRRIWKTLFCTVAMNQEKMVSVIPF